MFDGVFTLCYYQAIVDGTNGLQRIAAMTQVTQLKTEQASATFKALKCKECGAEYEPQAIHVCEECFGPLEVSYDYDALRRHVTRETIQAGPNSIWRYRPFLPVMTDNPIDVGTGMTPLVKSNRLARRLGLKNLYIKNDAVNMPTLSFKDRVVSVALTRARVLESFGQGAASLIECWLETGRTHQIRVHLAALGHPIVGDAVYGGKKQKRSDIPTGRHLLHAHSIEFSTPSGHKKAFTAPIPEDFAETLKKVDRSS